MTYDDHNTIETRETIKTREGLARFLAAALPVFRSDAEAAGMEATAIALDQAMSAINVDVPPSNAD